MPHTKLRRSKKPALRQDRRGLRFSFSASAEFSLEDSAESLRARVTELSLRGCFLEISGRFAERQRLQVKIFNANDLFEAPAEVIYLRKSGLAVLFGDMNPHFRQVLQKWILAALDRRSSSTRLE
jgi:PilZ domain